MFCLLRRSIIPRCGLCASTQESQVHAMKTDLLLRVDTSDKPVGTASKLQCHNVSEEPAGLLLHRAFSVFLFRRIDGASLLTQRAPSKITFPGHWTNTCCSHPLAPQETADRVPGIKAAASRRLFQELNLTIPPERISYHGRVLYSALNRLADGTTDRDWGEYELDYLLTAVLEPSDSGMEPVEDEVSALEWMKLESARNLIRQSSGPTPPSHVSPWFRAVLGDAPDAPAPTWWGGDQPEVRPEDDRIVDFGMVS